MSKITPTGRTEPKATKHDGHHNHHKAIDKAGITDDERSSLKEILEKERKHHRSKEFFSWLFTLGGMTNDAAFAAANMATQIAVFSKKAISDIPKGALYGSMALAACLSSFIEIVVYKESVFETLSNFDMVGKEHLSQISTELTLRFEGQVDRTLASTTFSPLKPHIDSLNTHNDIRPKTSNEYNNKRKDIKQCINDINTTLKTLNFSDCTLLEALKIIYTIDNIDHRRKVVGNIIDVKGSQELKDFYHNIKNINHQNHELSHLESDHKANKKELNKKIKAFKKAHKELLKKNSIKKEEENKFWSHVRESYKKEKETLIQNHKKDKEELEQNIRHKAKDIIASFEHQTLYNSENKVQDDKKIQLLLIDLISSNNEKEYILKHTCKQLQKSDTRLNKKIKAKKWGIGVLARFIVPLMVAPSVFFGCINVCSMIFASSTTGIIVFSYALSVLAAIAVTMYISNEIAKVIAQNKLKVLWLKWKSKFDKLRREKKALKVFLHVAIPFIILGSVITACAFGLGSYVSYAVNGLQMLWASIPAAGTMLITISSWCYMLGDIAGFTLMNMIESFNSITLKEIKDFFVDRFTLLKEQFVDDTNTQFGKIKNSNSHPLVKFMLLGAAALSTIIDGITTTIETLLMPLIFVGHLLSTSLTVNGNKDAAKSIAVTASATFNEGAQDLCFLHAHPNPVSIAFRFLFYIGPVFISNLIKSLIPFKQDAVKKEEDSPKNYGERFKFLMQKEWKHVANGRKPKAHQFLEHSCSSH